MENNNSNKNYKAHIFICTRCQNEDHPGSEYASELRAQLKSEAQALIGKDVVRVNAAGCLGVCQGGIHAVVYPQNKWFKKLSKSSIPQLLHYIKSIT